MSCKMMQVIGHSCPESPLYRTGAMLLSSWLYTTQAWYFIHFAEYKMRCLTCKCDVRNVK